MTWVLDLDGVIWLGDQAIAGAARAVARLRDAGERVLFATNNSNDVVAAQEAKLAGFGIDASGDVVTSAMASAELVEPGQHALGCGGPGVVEALAARGVTVADVSDARPGEHYDVVVVGFHRDFDWERMRIAVQAILAGARLIATNPDATYPTPQGPVPGGGAIAAGIAYAAGVEPEVAGKPYAPMAKLIHRLVGDEADGDGIVIGDRPESDGEFAVALGYRFGLVLSGVTAESDLPVKPPPDLIAPTLHALVAAQFPGRRRGT